METLTFFTKKQTQCLKKTTDTLIIDIFFITCVTKFKMYYYEQN